MMFDIVTKAAIFANRKTETRRLYNPKRRPAIPGQTHWIKIDRTPDVYGQIKILSCEPQRFGDLTKEDAIHEGFPTIEQYKEYFYKVNGYIDDNELVWVVKFFIIWCRLNGVNKNFIPNFFNKQYFSLSDLVKMDKKWRTWIILASEDEQYHPNELREKLLSFIINKLKDDKVHEQYTFNQIFNEDELPYIYKIWIHIHK